MRKLEHLFQLAKVAYWRHCATMADVEFPSRTVAGMDRTAHDIRGVLFFSKSLNTDTFLGRDGVAFGAFVSGNAWSKITGRKRYDEFSHKASPYEMRKSAAELFRLLNLADEKLREHLRGLADRKEWEPFFGMTAKYYFLKAGVCDSYLASTKRLRERIRWLSALPRYLKKPDESSWRNFRAYLYGCFALAYDPVPALCSPSDELPDGLERRLRGFMEMPPAEMLSERDRIHRALGALGRIVGHRVAVHRTSTLYWDRMLVKFRMSWFVSAMDAFEDGPAFARISPDLDVSEVLGSIAASDWGAGYRAVIRGGIRRFFTIIADPYHSASPWPVTIEEWRSRKDEILPVLDEAEERLKQLYEKHRK
jgi:hypothetical protein